MFEEISKLLRVIEFTCETLKTAYNIFYWLGHFICWSFYSLFSTVYIFAFNIIYGLQVAASDFELFLTDLFSILSSLAEFLTTIEFGEMQFKTEQILIPFVFIRDILLFVGFSVWTFMNNLIQLVVFLNNYPHVAAVLLARYLGSLFSGFPYESFAGLCLLSAFIYYIYSRHSYVYYRCLDYVKVACKGVKKWVIKWNITILANVYVTISDLMKSLMKFIIMIVANVYVTCFDMMKWIMKLIIVKTPTKAALKIQLEDEKAVRLCIICYDRVRNSIVLDCKHLCMCDRCARLIFHESRECPVCRSRIEDIITVFT